MQFSEALATASRIPAGYVANSFTKPDGFGRTVTVYAPGSTTPLRTIKNGVCYPIVLSFDSSGNLYVANEGGNTVTVYAPESKKVLRTISKGLTAPQAVAFGP